MGDVVEGGFGQPWKEPSISDRSAFLDKLGSMSKSDQNVISEEIPENEDVGPFSKVERLRASGQTTEAFFLARKMVTEGIEGAAEKVAEIMQDLEV